MRLLKGQILLPSYSLPMLMVEWTCLSECTHIFILGAHCLMMPTPALVTFMAAIVSLSGLFWSISSCRMYGMNFTGCPNNLITPAIRLSSRENGFWPRCSQLAALDNPPVTICNNKRSVRLLFFCTRLVARRVPTANRFVHSWIKRMANMNGSSSKPRQDTVGPIVHTQQLPELKNGLDDMDIVPPRRKVSRGCDSLPKTDIVE